MHQAVKWMLSSPGGALRNLAWRLPAEISSRRFCFIFGAPRSGTTLLQTCMAAHSRLFSVDGELALFSFGLDLFARERFAEYVEPAALDRAYAGSANVVQFADALYGALAGDDPDVGCVEKLPPHPLIPGYATRRFPRCRIVGIVRDGRDAYCSAQSHAHVRRTLGRNVGRFARAWKRRAARTLALEAMPNAMVLRYEDFVADPRAQLNRVMSFCGYPFEPVQLSPLKRRADRRVHETAFAKLGGAIDTGSVGRWRRELDADQIARFERIAGSTLLRAGYAPSGARVLTPRGVPSAG